MRDPFAPRLVARDNGLGGRTYFCTGCGCNFGMKASHQPGSDDCHRAREERDESRST